MAQSGRSRCYGRTLIRRAIAAKITYELANHAAPQNSANGMGARLRESVHGYLVRMPTVIR